MGRTDDKNVIVVGGGIGGLSAAVALRQQGFDVTVIERYPDLHSSVFGVGIIQPGNALRALDAIGCAEACVAVGYPAKQWGRMLDVNGDHLRDMPGVAIEGSKFPPLNGVTRPQLHEILTGRALAVGVQIHYGTSFAALEEGPESVTVVTESGERLTADVVVGADGVRSKVRQYVLGKEIEPKYIGQSAFRVNIPRLPEIDCIVLQVCDAGMAGFVPIGPDLAYMFYNAHFGVHERIPEDQLAPRLREYLAPFGGLTGRVRDEFITDDVDIVLRPEETMGVPTPWHKGRVVLMGDAVHTITPHLGQGAAQAIEDGVVLAEELAQNDRLDEAFARYTERRYERCKLIVDTSLNIGEWEMGRLPGFDNIGATNHVLEVMAQPL
ncbi:FAD-dependent oxidoreductase [Gryllotalpicola ginsengisoli]|uniref:FAD-dependent oxidoreductase n=1 Tax=Gryllotalpicola ginsengisoli TaxID=444608 RepID=UPI0003B3B097|nr:FAD-dependent oxidoreductase [Gryllotalpicola ginsengisoli]